MRAGTVSIILAIIDFNNVILRQSIVQSLGENPATYDQTGIKGKVKPFLKSGEDRKTHCSSFCRVYNSLTKLMESHNVWHPKVTNQITSDSPRGGRTSM